jgi:hypothetical protein
MRGRDWNLEQFLRFQLERREMWHSVKFYPYIMFTVREPYETTRWMAGSYDPSVAMIVKYAPELESARRFSFLIKSQEDWREYI